MGSGESAVSLHPWHSSVRSAADPRLTGRFIVPNLISLTFPPLRTKRNSPPPFRFYQKSVFITAVDNPARDEPTGSVQSRLILTLNSDHPSTRSIDYERVGNGRARSRIQTNASKIDQSRTIRSYYDPALFVVLEHLDPSVSTRRGRVESQTHPRGTRHLPTLAKRRKCQGQGFQRSRGRLDALRGVL
jgi:hypothetical protein